MYKQLCVFPWVAVLAFVAIESPVAQAELISGSDAGPLTQVNVFYNFATVPNSTYIPFLGFSGGVRVAAGDVSGDGVPDIIVGAGPGAPGGHVKVRDGNTQLEIRSFFAYAGFTGGVFVASGDINNDGFDDIITGTDAGGSHVKAFDGATNDLLLSFFAFDGFTGGVSVAAGDINNDGKADIITGMASGGVGQVKVFDGGNQSLLRSFLPYVSYTGGIFVAGGDVNGDGIDDIITSTDILGHIKVFDGVTNDLIRSFLPFPQSNNGVRVAAADINGDGFDDIVAGEGPGGGTLTVFSGLDLSVLYSFLPYGETSDGIFVAATNFVPEPTSAVLAASGGVLMLRVRANRRSR